MSNIKELRKQKKLDKLNQIKMYGNRRDLKVAGFIKCLTCKQTHRSDIQHVSKYQKKSKKQKEQARKKVKTLIHERMKKYWVKNVRKALQNPNEIEVGRILRTKTPFIWIGQQVCGRRIFDFYCEKLSIAIEIDGPEHDPKKDQWKDFITKREYGISVLRMKNRDYEMLDRLIEFINKRTIQLKVLAQQD